MLHVPQLVITPPSREPTPLLIQAPADWERYPAIRGLTDRAPVPPPKPRDSHSPSPTSRWGRRRPPAYRPPAPAAEPLNLPTPISESSEAQRWFMSGRARRSTSGEWERVGSDDEKYSSAIHDAAEDAFVYSDAKAREAGFHECHSLSRGAASLKHKNNQYTQYTQHIEYHPHHHGKEKDKEEHYRANEHAIQAAFGQKLDAELEADVDTSVLAFTTAYAHVAAQAQAGQANVYGYMDSWTTNRPITTLEHRKRRNRTSRPPPPVQTLDLPGSFAATGRYEEKVMEVENVVDESRRRRRTSFWSLRR